MDPRPGVLNTTAAVWFGGTDIRLEHLPLPTLGPGERLARIRLATVCGSDRHTVEGRRSSPAPSVLGHEAVGELVDTGERVVWGVAVSCGDCDRCRLGRTAKCRSVRKVGHESLDSGWPLSGGYAGHVLLPRGAVVVPVPDSLPDAVAAPAACATATVMAALEAAGPLEGRRVLVVGAGMLGLTAVAAAADRGAGSVAVTDLSAERLRVAEKFGATRSILAGGELPESDVVVELAGSSAAASAALDRLDVGGRLVLAGSVAPGPSLAVDPEHVVRRWLTVTGVHNYEPHHLREAIDYLDASQAHRPWSDLVSPPRPLADIARLLTTNVSARPRDAVVP